MAVRRVVRLPVLPRSSVPRHVLGIPAVELALATDRGVCKASAIGLPAAEVAALIVGAMVVMVRHHCSVWAFAVSAVRGHDGVRDVGHHQRVIFVVA